MSSKRPPTPHPVRGSTAKATSGGRIAPGQSDLNEKERTNVLQPGDWICPRCGAKTAGGWCGGCYVDWTDGLLDELLVAVPVGVLWRALKKARIEYRRAAGLPDPPPKIVTAQEFVAGREDEECWAEFERIQDLL